MWIAHFNSHFARPLGALVYSDEKVACIVIRVQNVFLWKEILEFTYNRGGGGHNVILKILDKITETMNIIAKMVNINTKTMNVILEMMNGMSKTMSGIAR